MGDVERAVALAPDNPAILAARGQIYLVLGRFDEAFADLDKAIAMGFQTPAVYYARGVIYEGRGQTSDAISDYKKSAKLQSRNDWKRRRKPKLRAVSLC